MSCHAHWWMLPPHPDGRAMVPGAAPVALSKHWPHPAGGGDTGLPPMVACAASDPGADWPALIWESTWLVPTDTSGLLQVSGIGYSGEGTVCLLPSQEVVKEFSNISVGKLVEVSIGGTLGKDGSPGIVWNRAAGGPPKPTTGFRLSQHQDVNRRQERWEVRGEEGPLCSPPLC